MCSGSLQNLGPENSQASDGVVHKHGEPRALRSMLLTALLLCSAALLLLFCFMQ
jgi:hypothetical protein